MEQKGFQNNETNNNNINFIPTLNFYNQQYQMQQMFYLFQNFCWTNGLNPMDYNSYIKFINNPNNFNINLLIPPIPPIPPIPQIPQISIIPNSRKNIYDTTENDKAEPIEILGRSEHIEFVNTSGSNIMDIIIATSSGFKVNLVLPGNTTINDMFKKYLDKLNLPYSHLGQDLIFLYNGKQIDPFSQLTLFPTFKSNITITVLDREVVNGG